MKKLLFLILLCLPSTVFAEEECVLEPVTCSVDADCTASSVCVDGLCIVVELVCYEVEPPTDAGVPVDAGPDAGFLPDAGSGPSDAGVDAGPGTDCSAIPVRYSSSTRHSPITCGALANIQSIAAFGARTDNVFMKVGDSNTSSGDHMRCFELENPVMSTYGYGALQSTVDHFRTGNVNGVTPYSRQSLSALGSQSAPWAFTGSPSPVQQELAVGNAAYATIMFGTNDLWWGGTGTNVAQKYRRVSSSLWKLIDHVEDEGVIPVLSSVPPHNGTPTWFHDLIPSLNHIIRGLAEMKQVPYMDLNSTLLPIPANGLGGDGIHLNRMSWNGVCNFGTTGLNYGHNNRNLISIESLDRVHRAAAYGDESPEDGPMTHTGAGTLIDPTVVDVLPFTASFGSLNAVGNACTSTMSGHAYDMTLDSSKNLRLLALTRDETSPIISVTDSGGACVVTTSSMVDRVFAAGTYTVHVSRLATDVLFVASEI